MKAVILAGGKGTRLGPLTYTTNKHLLPVGNLPMLLHSYELLDSIISHSHEDRCLSTLLITSPESISDFAKLLSHYPKWSKNTYYASQIEPAGIADAIRYSESFIDTRGDVADNKFLVILADNIIDKQNVAEIVKALDINDDKCHIWIRREDNPQNFGVPVFGTSLSIWIDDDEDGDAYCKNKLISIEEKPANPKSDYAMVGIYVLTKQVWNIIKEISPSNRGEYEITDVLNYYISNDRCVWHEYDGHWADLGHSVVRYYEEGKRLL